MAFSVYNRKIALYIMEGIEMAKRKRATQEEIDEVDFQDGDVDGPDEKGILRVNEEEPGEESAESSSSSDEQPTDDKKRDEREEEEEASEGFGIGRKPKIEISRCSCCGAAWLVNEEGNKLVRPGCGCAIHPVCPKCGKCATHCTHKRA